MIEKNEVSSLLSYYEMDQHSYSGVPGVGVMAPVGSGKGGKGKGKGGKGMTIEGPGAANAENDITLTDELWMEDNMTAQEKRERGDIIRSLLVEHPALPGYEKISDKFKVTSRKERWPRCDLERDEHRLLYPSLCLLSKHFPPHTHARAHTHTHSHTYRSRGRRCIGTIFTSATATGSSRTGITSTLPSLSLARGAFLSPCSSAAAASAIACSRCLTSTGK